jgi:hypothetical protein
MDPLPDGLLIRSGRSIGPRAVGGRGMHGTVDRNAWGHGPRVCLPACIYIMYSYYSSIRICLASM